MSQQVSAPDRDSLIDIDTYWKLKKICPDSAHTDTPKAAIMTKVNLNGPSMKIPTIRLIYMLYFNTLNVYWRK